MDREKKVSSIVAHARGTSRFRRKPGGRSGKVERIQPPSSENAIPKSLSEQPPSPDRTIGRGNPPR